MFHVYTIRTFPATSNAYAVSRSENWQAEKIATFDRKEEALECIRERSRLHTDLPLYLHSIHDPVRKSQFIDEFCFTDDTYLTKRRFFLGPPPVAAICRALRQEGTKVL